MIIGRSVTEGYLSRDEIETIVSGGLEALSLDGRRVLIVIPDRTRTLPMPYIFSLFDELLATNARYLDYMVALGTHPPLDDRQLSLLVGRQIEYGRYGTTRILNHEWQRTETFARLGSIPAEEIKILSEGLLNQEVLVKVNRLVLGYDQVIICGPVFPHEVAGFSGGNKYIVPGIAGEEIINLTHWLGALLTSWKVIGKATNPVRAIIDRAAGLIHVPMACFAWVVEPKGVAGVYFGPAREAWKAAADLSGIRHITYKEHPFKKVLSIMPEMYEDLWTAAKGMYKLEPVVADGGEIIIYAPHIRAVSYTYGKLLDEIGYHCRDYYLAQWEKFKEYPGGVLAHSTHLKGLGKFDTGTMSETPRIQVTLATGISAERCRRINLGYMDPHQIDISAWENREDEGILVVPQAGERLFRLKERQTIETGKP